MFEKLKSWWRNFGRPFPCLSHDCILAREVTGHKPCRNFAICFCQDNSKPKLHCADCSCTAAEHGVTR